ncbi:LOW QUALITY PROTEIN: hypothetical protein MC885_012164 [Smutsia gigantea]|nr:LOW QUALITY PROTEIN: hypothetical protein MC885_012164 [Smutsia gigantea]
MKSPVSAQVSSEPVLRTRKMSHLCLSAGLLVLLSILAASTQGQTTSSLSQASPPTFCLEPPYTGPCRAIKYRWFFNATSRLCEIFTYGGCKGEQLPREGRVPQNLPQDGPQRTRLNPPIPAGAHTCTPPGKAPCLPAASVLSLPPSSLACCGSASPQSQEVGILWDWRFRPPLTVRLPGTGAGKTGVCPEVELDLNCTQDCLSDGDCADNLKCCQAGCAAVCHMPNEKQGSCPEVDIAFPQLGICQDQCQMDSQCAGQMKCCRNGCGKVSCITPVF